MMNEEFVPDVSLPSVKDKVLIAHPHIPELVRRLKSKTNARLGIGHAGDRLKTETMLKFRADHAIAQDAVWTEIDESVVDELGFYKVQPWSAIRKNMCVALIWAVALGRK